MSNTFQQAVVDYYRSNGRSFFWREESLDAFDWLLIEMLLKRTSASTVNNYGKPVLQRFQQPEDIISTPQDELAEVLRPFGLYNRRSKNLNNVCETLISEYDGTIPRDRDDLSQINGIGEYIADAIVCFGFHEPVLVLDTNTALVAEELFNITPADDLRLDETIRPTLEPLVPENRPRKFNWGMLDIGAELRNDDLGSLPDFPSPDRE